MPSFFDGPNYQNFRNWYRDNKLNLSKEERSNPETEQQVRETTMLALEAHYRAGEAMLEQNPFEFAAAHGDFRTQDPKTLARPFHDGSHEYLEGWKTGRGYFDEQGFYSDEWSSELARMEKEWGRKLKTEMPKTEYGWRKLFGLLTTSEEKNIDKDTVRDRVDFVGLLERYGVHVGSVRRTLILECPFHEDRSPSLSVDTERKLWNCHAGCGGGDVFAFVMKQDKCTFVEALNILNEMF